MTEKKLLVPEQYDGLLRGVVYLLEEARRTSARSVNTIMTAAYWQIGRQIVEREQEGRRRAGYGEALIERLAVDLTTRFGRGFSRRNLFQMREFYIAWPIVQTPPAQLEGVATPQESAKMQTSSAKLGARTVGGVKLRKGQTLPDESGARTLHEVQSQESQTLSGELATGSAAGNFQTMPGKSSPPEIGAFPKFPLPWSHYVRLLSVKDAQARAFYEAEALRGGWSVRQLDRQISTLFYERTALSRNKAAMLRKGKRDRLGDETTPEEEIKDPLVLEFLGLKDEYSEAALEEALILHLEHFLLELGNDFAFVARQKRLRVGDEWYRIDLVFFHRRLKCLILIDLKTGKFTHADAGQMNLYLNYAREHWTHTEENPPVGLILCAKGDEAVAHYALGNLRNKVLAGEYRLALPAEKQLVAELERTQKALEAFYRRREP